MKRGGGSEIHYQANPNFGTLLFYVFHYLEDIKGFGKYLVQPSKNPIKFKSNLTKYPYKGRIIKGKYV